MEILRHNVVSDKPNAFNKIFTLFLCKIVDENRNPDEQLHFQWLEGEDNHISFQKRLTDLYNRGMLELLEKKVTDVSDSEFDKQFLQVETQYKDKFKEILTEIRLKKNNEFAIKEVYDDEMFMTKLAPEAIKQRLSVTKESDWLIDKRNAGEKLTPEDIKAGTDVIETKTESVKLLKVKGMWYVDRRDGQMKYRLLGIAAMGPDPTMMAEKTADGVSLGNKDELIDLFWVYYPDAREVLANSVVFNSKNLSSDLTYDDILNARRFSSIIYKSDNGLGTGIIKDYIPNDAEEQLEESDRIKNQILEMENDMWNY